MLSGIASALHWPAAMVPMGYSHANLPSALQLLGRPWSEPILIELAYAYEQATPGPIRGKGVRKIVPPHPSHLIMRRFGADLEEKQEPRGASVAEAQNSDSMR
jgi:hypothetical protein